MKLLLGIRFRLLVRRVTGSKMGILTNYLNVFKQAKPYSLYVLFLLLVVYMHNQLDRYALSITSIEIAQELKYGDKSCMKLDASVSTADAKKCSNLNETVCVRTNITVNGTEKPICKYDYNGQGIEYQVKFDASLIKTLPFSLVSLIDHRRSSFHSSFYIHRNHSILDC